MLSMVDLPEPEAPMIATSSPSRTRKSTSRSACTCTSPIWYTFEIFSKRTSGSGSTTCNTFIRYRQRGAVPPQNGFYSLYYSRNKALSAEDDAGIRLPAHDFVVLVDERLLRANEHHRAKRHNRRVDGDGSMRRERPQLAAAPVRRLLEVHEMRILSPINVQIRRVFRKVF